MKVISISQEAYELCNQRYGVSNPDGTRAYNMDQYRAAAEEIKVGLNTPIDLCYASKVTYDPKTDRYTVTFTGSDHTATLKATNAVAELVTTYLRQPGSWLGRMEEGVLVDANLLQV